MPSLLERVRQVLASRYDVERELDSGGMGSVFLARDLRLDRHVAVKILRPEIATASAAERFLREARILARLKHPKVVPVHDADEVDGLFYYVMDFVEGETMARRLSRGVMSADEVVQVGHDVLEALKAAHGHGIVHRDVKPSNVFLVEEGAVLSDFGIAKPMREEKTPLTLPGFTVGTPGYMAPEQAAGDKVTPATDIYAVGMVLYEALAGRRWSPLTPQEQVDWSGVPRDLVAVLGRALAWAPDDRWPDAAAFCHALLRAAPDARPRRPRRRTVAGAVALVVLLIAAGWLAVQRTVRQPGVELAERVPSNRIAVFPFSVDGGAELAYLAEGMMDLLSTLLNVAADLHSVEPEALLGVLGPDGGATLDANRAREIADLVGAGRYILGSVEQAEDRLLFRASLYDEKGVMIASATALGGGGVTIYAVVDELATKLFGELSGKAGTGLHSLAALTTGSEDALYAYLEGERAIRAGGFQEAVSAYERAVRLDTLFALAYYGLAEAAAAVWLRPSVVALAAERAARLGERLPEHYRDLLTAAHALRTGAGDKAEDLYQEIISSNPNEAKAWFELAEKRFHYDPLRGGSISKARGAFEEVLENDPTNVFSLDHLAVIAAAEGEMARLDSLVSRGVELNPESPLTFPMRTLRAFTLGDEAVQNMVLLGLRPADDFSVTMSLAIVAVYSGNLGGAERVSMLLTETGRRPEVRAVGHVMLAHLKLARGRWSEAQAELEKVAAIDPAAALEYRALLAQLPFIKVPLTELEALRRELVDWDAAGVPSSGSLYVFFSAHDDVHRHLRGYLLGLLTAQLGDNSAALRYADQLEGLDAPSHARTLPGDLALSIRAQVGRISGEPAEALRALERIRMETWYQLTSVSAFHSRAYERYMRAELLNLLGREDDALRWYSSFAHTGPQDLIYLAPSHLGRADIYRRQGRNEEAARHYRRFLELWKDCDPVLRPLVSDAEDRLRRLTEGTASQ